MNDIVDVIMERINTCCVGCGVFNISEPLVRSFAADFSDEPNFETIVDEVLFRMCVIYLR